jgi:hypothetical protein
MNATACFVTTCTFNCVSTTLVIQEMAPYGCSSRTRILKWSSLGYLRIEKVEASTSYSLIKVVFHVKTSKKYDSTTEQTLQWVHNRSTAYPYELKDLILTLYEQYTNISTKNPQRRSSTFQFNLQATPFPYN